AVILARLPPLQPPAAAVLPVAERNAPAERERARALDQRLARPQRFHGGGVRGTRQLDGLRRAHRLGNAARQCHHGEHGCQPRRQPHSSTPVISSERRRERFSGSSSWARWKNSRASSFSPSTQGTSATCAATSASLSSD